MSIQLMLMITCGCAGLVKCSVIICDVCRVEPLAGFQNKRVTTGVLWTTTNMTSRAECASRCSLFEVIKSFGYKDASGECVAHTVPLGTTGLSFVEEMGFFMYSTCAPVNGGVSSWSSWSGSCTQTCGTSHTVSKTRSRTCTNPAPAHGGSDCTETLSETSVFNCGLPACLGAPPHFGTCSSSCSGTNRVCNNGYCVCNIMYVRRGDSCVQGCGPAGYGSGFTLFHNKLLTGNNDKIVSSVQSVEACMNLCLSETDFTCATADYYLPKKNCNLSKTPWYSASSTSHDTNFHQIIRNCA